VGAAKINSFALCEKEDSMSMTVEGLLADFTEELNQISRRYTRFARIAEEEGFSQLAKFFRAMVASETARSNLIRTGMTAHAEETPDFFVCPNCGLVFMLGAPEKCPVDQTPGPLFETIS
jgi:rubrerythrin